MALQDSWTWQFRWLEGLIPHPKQQSKVQKYCCRFLEHASHWEPKYALPWPSWVNQARHQAGSAADTFCFLLRCKRIESYEAKHKGAAFVVLNTLPGLPINAAAGTSKNEIRESSETCSMSYLEIDKVCRSCQLNVTAGCL